MDANEERVLANVRRYGCHVFHVLEEDDLPPFSYSVGIAKTAGAPEAIVIGLPGPVGNFVVNEYHRRVKEGERFLPGGCFSGFLEGFDVTVEPVAREHYEEYFGWDRWLYDGDGFDALQVVYPSTRGTWPWDRHASDGFRAGQPVLGPGPFLRALQKEDDADATDLVDLYEGCADFLAAGAAHASPRGAALADLEASRAGGSDFRFVVGPEGSVLGVVDFLPGEPGSAGAPLSVNLLMLAPEHQNRGVGTAVVGRLEALAAARGVLRLAAAVQVENAPGRRFWERLGYAVVAGPDRNDDGTTVLHLSKRLG